MQTHEEGMGFRIRIRILHTAAVEVQGGSSMGILHPHAQAAAAADEGKGTRRHTSAAVVVHSSGRDRDKG
jgi:hypothetical protein